MEIIRALENHISLVLPLFDAYRIFYKQTSDQQKAKEFLEKRLQAKESIIFLALDNGTPIGFTQLYTSFSSVTMQSFYILNDLFVLPSYRKKGIGKALLIKAKEQCNLVNYKGLALETEHKNSAQYLYEKLDWKKDEEHLHYFWTAAKIE